MRPAWPALNFGARGALEFFAGPRGATEPARGGKYSARCLGQRFRDQNALLFQHRDLRIAIAEPIFQHLVVVLAHIGRLQILDSGRLGA